jgi:hypothetical protein
MGSLKDYFSLLCQVPFTITCLLLLLHFNISAHFSLSFSEFLISLHLFVPWSDIIFHHIINLILIPL